MIKCSVSWCHKESKSSMYCRNHYRRNRLYGSPYGGRTSNWRPLAWIDEHKVWKGDGCLQWPFSLGRNGYGRITVNCDNGRKHTSAHRIMCEAVYGESQHGANVVAHSCNNRGCVNPTHLRWATYSENAHDMKAHGTAMFGERHYKSRLTVDQVNDIIKDRRNCVLIAKDYGVSRSNISNIKNGKTWSLVTCIKANEVAQEDLDNTARGAGVFGSTGLRDSELANI